MANIAINTNQTNGLPPTYLLLPYDFAEERGNLLSGGYIHQHFREKQNPMRPLYMTAVAQYQQKNILNMSQNIYRSDQ